MKQQNANNRNKVYFVVLPAVFTSVNNHFLPNQPPRIPFIAATPDLSALLLSSSSLCLQIRSSPRGCTCETIPCSGTSPPTASWEFPPPRRPPTTWTPPSSVAPPPRKTPGTRTCCLPCTCINTASQEKEVVGDVYLCLQFLPKGCGRVISTHERWLNTGFQI